MAIPFLKALRKEYPNAQITLLCVKKNQAAFKHVTLYDKLLVFDNIQDYIKNNIHLFRTNFDVVFDLEPFRKITSIISYFTGSNIRIGFDTNRRRHLYTHIVTYHNEKSYESHNMLRQLAVLGRQVPPDEANDMSFILPNRVVEGVDGLLRSLEVDLEKDFVVAVCPGVLKPHHRWIMKRFAELIEAILEEDGRTKVLLVGAAQDGQDAHEVLQFLGDTRRVVNLVGKTNFDEALGVLRSCRILIASDGGIVYAAAAMACCTISLWGPGVMDRFKPPGPHHIGIRKNYSCVPCVNYSRLGEFPPCPYDRRCLNDITAAEVLEQFVLLKNRHF
jgi:ADP-heptose:LPS heptosyltransferase